jgi:hypothetical protein
MALRAEPSAMPITQISQFIALRRLRVINRTIFLGPADQLKLVLGAATGVAAKAGRGRPDAAASSPSRAMVMVWSGGRTYAFGKRTGSLSAVLVNLEAQMAATDGDTPPGMPQLASGTLLDRSSRDSQSYCR